MRESPAMQAVLAPCPLTHERVHSALEAVGLTAAVRHVLTEAGISANVVAGCAHDHVFVPLERADEVSHART